MKFLHDIAQWLVMTLEPYGAPGLMLIAICDSSFLSLPEVNDAALMALSINNPSRMWELAAMTVLGSVIGCTLLYSVGRKGGEALLRRRFAEDKIQRVRGWYQKYGMLAVIVPSLLPPPLPFKIFVLCAGAFQIPWSRFLLAVAIGRSIRYFSEGIIAVLYGKQALQIVAENFAIAGALLAGLIVAVALFVVYNRRRRINAGIIVLPLVILLGSGCVKTVPPGKRPLPWYPLTREQATVRLENISQNLKSISTVVSLSASTPKQDDPTKRYETPISLNGPLFMERPNRLYLSAGVLLNTFFDMVSDGTNYQFYNDQANELFTNGQEFGPPAKPFSHLSPTINQFVGMKPRVIHEALMLDVDDLFQRPGVIRTTYTVFQDRKHYLVVDFIDASDAKEARVLEKLWFDLTSKEADIVRRQTFYPSGELETDTEYSGHQSVSDSLRYPSKSVIHLFDTDTTLEIRVDPKETRFNYDIDPSKFEFEPHPGAKVFKFEPRDVGVVKPQQ